MSAITLYNSSSQTGQSLALLLKLSPSIYQLHLPDANLELIEDLSAINTSCYVSKSCSPSFAVNSVTLDVVDTGVWIGAKFVTGSGMSVAYDAYTLIMQELSYEIEDMGTVLAR